MNKLSNCIVCASRLTGRQYKFCCTDCKNKIHQSYAAQKDRGLQRKLKIVKDLGGRCSICDYDKNIAALTFHHVDPSLKEFKLDMRSLSNRTEKEILKEVSKCQLLCSNCHLEAHNPGLGGLL